VQFVQNVNDKAVLRGLCAIVVNGYSFSKNCAGHNAVSYFVALSYNFCWPVRTLRVKKAAGQGQDSTPATAAKWVEHV